MRQKGKNMMESKLKSFVGFDFNSAPNPEWIYERLQRTARAELRKMMLSNKIIIHKFIKSHFHFSAILKDEKSGCYIYVAIQDVRFMEDLWWNRVLYRTMNNDKDYAGGINHYCKWTELDVKINKLLEE